MKLLVALLLFVIAVPAEAKIKPPQTTPDNFIKVGHDQIFRITAGEGDQVVILHGLPDHSLNQRRLVQGLAAWNSVLAYDRKGMGLSDKPDLPYTLWSQADELEDVLETMHINRTVIVGHSIGGTLAMLYASKHPERVKAVVLMNPVIYFEPGHTGLRDWSTWFLKQPTLGEGLMMFQSRFMTRMILEHLFYDPAKVTPEMVNSYHFPFQMKGTKQHFLGTLRSLYDMQTAGLLRAVDEVKRSRVPVWVVWTANDQDMPLSDGQALAVRLGADLHVIQKCGHLPQLELDDERLMNDLIEPMEKFLQDVKKL